MRKYRINGQVVLEYAVLIVCVVAALYAMQNYMKRAIQGKVKLSGDQISEPYDSSATTLNITTSVNSQITTNATAITNSTGEVVGVKFDSDMFENVSRSGYEYIGAWGDGTIPPGPGPGPGPDPVASDWSLFIPASVLASVNVQNALTGWSFTLTDDYYSKTPSGSDQFNTLYNTLLDNGRTDNQAVIEALQVMADQGYIVLTPP